jgi:hypothetical protein
MKAVQAKRDHFGTEKKKAEKLIADTRAKYASEAATFRQELTVGTGGLCRAGTYPKLHAPMLAKIPKMHPKYPKIHIHHPMQVKVPKIPPEYPKWHIRWA